ncbi:hypothetical protein [Thalassospira australica]|uniref:hypothetical protein n=1 Tax=Thalassospira australica TaxID=1528106 RepID=UPI0038501E0F
MARRLDDKHEIEFRNRENLGREYQVTGEILKIGTGGLIHTVRGTGRDQKKAEDSAYQQAKDYILFLDDE